MIVSVSNPDGSKNEFTFDEGEESILIGRGQNSDIIISDDHISRKHLEIKRYEGNIYIKDVTLSNWVSFNDEKLEKGVDVQYFDFAPLKLPGGYGVKVSEESPQEDDAKTSTFTSTNVEILRKDKKARRLAKNKSNKSKKSKRTTKSDNNKVSQEGIKMFLILLAMGAFLFYQFFLNKDENHTSRPPIQKRKAAKAKKKANKKRTARPKSTRVGPQNLQSAREQNKRIQEVSKPNPDYDLIVRSKPCATSQFRIVCQKIFQNRSKREGLVQKGSTVYAFKNYNIRASNLLRGPKKLRNSKISFNDLKLIVAGENILMPSFLKMMELNDSRDVVILLFTLKDYTLKVIGKYKVDIANYRKYSQQNYVSAYGKITSNQKINDFDRYLRPFIKEVKL